MSLSDFVKSAEDLVNALARIAQALEELVELERRRDERAR